MNLGESDRIRQAEELAWQLEGLYLEPRQSARAAPYLGGRREALSRLEAFDVRGYASTRNDVREERSGVSRLSPYIRHGVLGLREVAEAVRERYGDHHDSRKFWAELGWRQFWKLVHRAWGDAIYEPMEEAKVALGERPLPAELREGRTGLVCMDAAIRDLLETGYMHNHARMWVASYVVHTCKVDWREGERWFYQHLLDGDPASNALSWQWIASTFSHKPYIFNRENVRKYSGDTFCASCSASCPFDADYPELEARLFARPVPLGQAGRVAGLEQKGWQDLPLAQSGRSKAGGKTLVWLHGDSLSILDPALQAYPEADRVLFLTRNCYRNAS
ncbi:MAG: DNA photolyase [Blastochloris sp.]|nr:DNA photolyase [Blastochloris sp.]